MSINHYSRFKVSQNVWMWFTFLIFFLGVLYYRTLMGSKKLSAAGIEHMRNTLVVWGVNCTGID